MQKSSSDTVQLPEMRQVYYNPKQIEFLKGQQRIKVLVAGRGFGKGVVLGTATYMTAFNMPGSRSFLTSATFNLLKTKTLPPMEAKWNELGLKEYVHYVIGERPPKHFEEPLAKTREYDNFITFCNGSQIELISLDRPQKNRGGSYQAGFIDETLLIKHEHVTKVLIPSMRGFVHKFHDSPFYRQLVIVTSMPFTSTGLWVLDYEEKAAAQPEKYLYMEATSWDNVDVLGAETIKDWEEEMPYLEYQVEVMNKRVRQAKDGFYNKLNVDHHCYTPQYKYGSGKRGTEANAREDFYRKGQILEASFDFSGWFNCTTMWQEHGGIEYCLGNIYVKDKEKINELVDKICKTYQHHGNRYMRVWGEPRGHDRNAIGDDIYSLIKTRFETNGWRCEIKAQAGRTTNHKERHTFVNDILSEDYEWYPKVRFNQEQCKDAIIAMQICEMLPTFQKDKSKEKDRNFPQEHAPHLTDTIDYYLVQKHGWKANRSRNTRAGRAWTA